MTRKGIAMDIQKSRRAHSARRWGAACLSLHLAAVAAGLGASLRAQEPAEYFRQMCFSCHTIGGGRITGPDLKDVESRKNREWLVNFILDPQGVIDSGDPYAAKLLSDARGVVMPRQASMTRDLANELLDLIAEESQLEESQFRGLQITDEPFTSARIQEGRDLFLGLSRLQGGGASCVSCHSVAGTGALGGGRLGDDLTRVYERLGGRQALASWLLAPATQTMRPLFADKPMTQEEILSLVAFLEDSARNPRDADPAADTMNFFVLGLGGAVLCLAGFGSLWQHRFRSVRRALLERNSEGRMR